MYIPFSFRKKSKKLSIATKSLQNVVLQVEGMRAFYHMIRGLSVTLSCNEALVINYFLFPSLFQNNCAWAIMVQRCRNYLL